MADKLSFDKVILNQPLAQIKTGDIFKVYDIDRISKKATIIDSEGNEKIVSRATLERWYRELTDDEVQKWKESKEPKKNEDGADASPNNADDEAGEDANSAALDSEAIGGNTGFENSGELAGGHTEHDSNDSIGVGEDDSDTGRSDIGHDEDGVTSPITPSNAGKDKDRSKEGRKDTEAAKKNAALMKVRQTIIDTVLADSASIQLKRTGSYDVLKEKNNFAEITRGTNRFNVSVMSASLTEDQINKVKINPASFGWSIDADFTVFDEGDIEMAVQLIRQSREYRLAHPVTRKKKEPAAGKGAK